MAGTNIGLMYEDRGYTPLMGITEAKEKAEKEGAKCPKCDKEPDSTFYKTLIHRYGICVDCLKGKTQ